MKPIALLFVAALAGCATTEGYKQMLDSWLGAPEVALIRQWGPPLRSYDSGGSRFLTYSEERNMVIPGTAPTYKTSFIGNTAYTTTTGGTPATSVTYGCETTFEIEDGRVVAWRAQGNDCTARSR